MRRPTYYQFWRSVALIAIIVGMSTTEASLIRRYASSWPQWVSAIPYIVALLLIGTVVWASCYRRRHASE